MQQYFYPNPPYQVSNPATSKALTKLKNDKLIIPNQPQYLPPQQSFHQNRSYNINRPGSFNNAQTSYSRNPSPSPIQPAPLTGRQMKGPNNSFSASQTSQNNISQSQRLHFSNATYTQPSQVGQTLQHQPSQPIIGVSKNQGGVQSIMKPFSAVNNSINNSNNQNNLTNSKNMNNYNKNIATTQNQTRVRSSSTTQLHLQNNQYVNQRQVEQRIKYLDSKINDYSQQILSATTKLTKKQAAIAQMQKQLSMLRQINGELELKLVQYTQKLPVLQNKVKVLSEENQKLKSSKNQVELENQKNMEKVMTIQSNLDKMQQNKNLQIQSLNHSCVELSKNVERLHQKYSQQTRNLKQTIQELEHRIQNHEHTIQDHEHTIQSQQATISGHESMIADQLITINQNKLQIQNMSDRIKLFEKSSQSREQDLQMLSRLSNQQINKISSLEIQNNNLKMQLSNCIEQLDLFKQNFFGQRDLCNSIKEEFNRVRIDYQNAKKIGQQQIQFLQTKLQESNLQKERLVEQLQLTKAVTLKRNMIFQRQVIYELKAENDRLWAKLIDQSQNRANIMQNDPQYWNLKRFATSNYSNKNNYEEMNIKISSQKNNIYNNTFNNNNNAFNSNIPNNNVYNSNNNPYKHLQQQYLRFIQQLEKQQEKAQQLITNINEKQVKNNTQDILFYKNKCFHLEEMIQEHLKINLSLKQQLQKSHPVQPAANFKPADAQIVFLKGQLNKQQILNQTLQRSLELLKSEYELKFKAAQAKVSQIQNQQDLAYNNTDELRKQLSQAQYQILRLTNQNFAIKNRLQSSPSKQTKYQDMYYELLSTIEKRGSISQFNAHQNHQTTQQTASLNNEIRSLKELIAKKEDEYQTLSNLHQQNCQAFEQQLTKKSNQMLQLQMQHQKLYVQYQSNKYRVDQLVKQFNRVEKQLSAYKRSGTNLSMSGVNSPINDALTMSGNLRMSGTGKAFDKKMTIYYTSLLRAKLLQLDAFVKQLKQVHSVLEGSLKSQGVTQIKEAPYIQQLILNAQRVIENCLSTCSQLEVTCRE